MKIKVDSYLNGDTVELKGSSSDAPVEVVIKGVKVIPAIELGFDSEDDRYEVGVDIKGEHYDWMPNKTSLKTVVGAYGAESDAWIDKKIKVYLVDQNVSGKMKKVVYAKV